MFKEIYLGEGKLNKLVRNIIEKTQKNEGKPGRARESQGDPFLDLAINWVSVV